MSGSCRRRSSLAHAFSADGFTALHYPAFFGGDAAGGNAQALIDAGADPNARSDERFSVLPLHSAVAGDHDDVVVVLLAAGADVNATQRHGLTPLHGAAQNGAEATVDRLLAAGADRDGGEQRRRTAADLAEEAGHAELAARLGSRTPARRRSDMNLSANADAIPCRARPPWPCRSRGDRGPASSRGAGEGRRS